MIAFIDDHREAHGVEPICKVLPTAPSTYYDHVARRRDPAGLSARAKRDMALKVEVRRVFEENFRVYGVRKVRRQLQREGFDVARCTVGRLMREMGLQGVIRGKPIRTTVSDKAAPCPLEKVNRQFHAPAPNRLWVSDFTYVATWAGFVYVAFVIDAYARRIAGWRVSRTAHAGFVLDALEQALHARHHQALRAGLEAMGLSLLVDAADRLPQLNTVAVPDGVDEALVRKNLLAYHGLEIGAGLGALAGKVWRIGLMGTSSSANHVTLCLAALEGTLAAMDAPIKTGVALGRRGQCCFRVRMP